MKKADSDRYKLLLDLGCIVCLIHEHAWTPPEIHHPYGRTKDGNQKTIGLCFYHHREGSDCDAYTSRHPFKARFIERYGSEEYLLEETNKRLKEASNL